MMVRSILVLLLAVLLWCPPPGAAAPVPPSLIVDAADLPAILAQFRPVVLAAKSKLGARSVGYLRGAVLVDEDQWTAASRRQQQLNDLTAWGRRIGALGIEGNRMVIVYDDGELKFASRVRYLLAHLGVSRAVLVNGGWPALAKLVARGVLQRQSAPASPVPQSFPARVTQPPIPVATRADVIRAINQHTATILDVRSPQEYAGTRLLPPVTRGGHVPGAVNLPLPELFVAGRDNRLMGPSDLAKVFRFHGIDLGRPIIVYCQDGARSSLAALALLEAGYPSVSLYYLSYLDWQSDPMLPIAK
jgi:thiosulfate/3-mercaptopyruvate sulfurtransferase